MNEERGEGDKRKKMELEGDETIRGRKWTDMKGRGETRRKERSGGMRKDRRKKRDKETKWKE